MLALAGQQVVAQGLDPYRPPALVMNMHVTGLAVARSLGRAGVSVLGLDDERGGLGQHSRHLAGLGLVPGPAVNDGSALAEHLLALGPSFAQPPVLFACNDDWVLALAKHADALRAYYRLPFAGYDVLQRALGKSALARACTRLGVPTPRTWHLPAELDAVEYPCVLKPDDSRAFWSAFQTKVFLVADRGELDARVREAAAYGIVLLAQERIDTGPGGFWSVASYLSADGTARGVFTGRKLEQWPAGFGTCCLADSRWDASLAEAGVAVLRELGYHGISEVEFVQHPDTGEHLLIDVNTRPWKWVGLPVAAGVDLPLLAYRDAVANPFDAGPQVDGVRWTMLRDYVPLWRSGALAVPHEQVSRAEWLALLAGRADGLVDAVHDVDDPEPAYDVLLDAVQGGSGYACAC